MSDYLQDAREQLGEEDAMSDTVLCGAMLMAACQHGSRLCNLEWALGISQHKLRPFWRRFKENGVFTPDGKICPGDWDDEEVGGTAFLMDVMVGTGLLERA